MKNGYLKVNVYSGTIANPVKGAKVSIFKDGNVVSTYYTDENGMTPLITLETVDKNLSLEEQYKTRPYETYDIKVEAIGLTETNIEGVQIFDGITSIQDVYMTSIDENNISDTYNITPNTLWGDYPPYLESNENENAGISPIVLKEVLIPQNIIVHDGVPSNTNAPNYTVPFTDYIKNVASSEIYSTWPVETIKANVLAIISFTLNRIYTEWYKSRGYDFTITSTTNYDQKYTRNGTIFEPISNVVDEIFTDYIKSGIRMEPLLAHYKSNTNESGYLSQWGSKELGDKGYNALNILRYYYGNNVNIYEAKVTESYPYSFTRILKNNDCGEDVYLLQNALNYIRGSYPLIPIIKNPSGLFDNNTKEAVKKFQEIFSLEQTGDVNYQTWYKISYVLTAVTDLTNNVYNF